MPQSYLGFLVVSFVSSSEHGLSILEKSLIHNWRIVGGVDDVRSRAEQYELDVGLVGPMNHETVHANPTITFKPASQ
jgi:hypothetical protein